MNQKQIAILGSTGSIGQSTLEVALHLKENIRIRALAAHSNIDRLEKQIHAFRPDFVAVFDAEKALELQKRLPGTPVLAGKEGLVAVATAPGADFVVSAIV